MAITHQINASEVKKILQSQSGPVQRDMLRRGIRVQNRAKQLLTTRKPGVDTGRLRSSVSVEQMSKGNVTVTRVGTNVEYAIYVHDGTRYMKGNPFLKDALPAARA